LSHRGRLPRRRALADIEPILLDRRNRAIIQWPHWQDARRRQRGAFTLLQRTALFATARRCRARWPDWRRERRQRRCLQRPRLARALEARGGGIRALILGQAHDA
jgi:hypothetical protein